LSAFFCKMARMKKNIAIGVTVLAGAAAVVGSLKTSSTGVPMGAPAASPSGVMVANETGTDATVYVAFGADSKVGPAEWPGCPSSGLVCQFPLAAHASKALPTGGKYLNATMSLDAPVGCGSTKAELNVNNPNWFDVVDVSLVDGFNKPVQIELKDSSGMHTFEAKAATGNEKALGVYPNGCDICVAREHPPCGIQPGKDGCKAGSQFNPEPPCQYQSATKGGGSTIKVSLLP
jgi:hypothetical protein